MLSTSRNGILKKYPPWLQRHRAQDGPLALGTEITAASLSILRRHWGNLRSNGYIYIYTPDTSLGQKERPLLLLWLIAFIYIYIYIALFSALEQTHCALVACDSEWVNTVLSLQSAVSFLHGRCLVKLLPSRLVLCTPYNHAPRHFMQSHMRKVRNLPSELAVRRFRSRGAHCSLCTTTSTFYSVVTSHGTGSVSSDLENRLLP